MGGSVPLKKVLAYVENCSITFLLNIATTFFFPYSLIPQKTLSLSPFSSISGKCLAFNIF